MKQPRDGAGLVPSLLTDAAGKALNELDWTEKQQLTWAVTEYLSALDAEAGG